MKKINVLILLPLFISSPAIAQQDCTQAMENLKNHQKIMRKGYSATQGEKLRNKERKLFDAYQTCLKFPASHSTRRTSEARNGKKKQKTTSTFNYSDAPQIKWQNKSLSFRGKFSGEKQKAWLRYYKQPKQCGKPKSLQVFAWCTEHKTKSSEVFSELWHSK